MLSVFISNFFQFLNVVFVMLIYILAATLRFHLTISCLKKYLLLVQNKINIS